MTNPFWLLHYARHQSWAAGSNFLGESEMSGSDQCSSQPQFMTSVGTSSSNGPGTPLIGSIDVDQFVIPEVLGRARRQPCPATATAARADAASSTVRPTGDARARPPEASSKLVLEDSKQEVVAIGAQARLRLRPGHQIQAELPPMGLRLTHRCSTMLFSFTYLRLQFCKAGIC